MESEAWERWLYWARCKLGRDRYYWVVSELGGDRVLSEGFAASEEEAETAARSAAEGIRAPGERIHRWLAGSAAHWHRRKVAERRKREGRRSGAGQVREYLYTHHWPEQWPDYWCAHPILKRTARRVFVSRRYCPVDELGTDREDWHLKVRNELEEAIVLDREKLEREGHAYSRSAHDCFYLKPETEYERQASAATLEDLAALEVLGLRWPCSAAEVKVAYRRLARATHPDVGGSAERFRQVNEAYERIAGLV
jgi:curved DNA-binding protein CbpA